MLYQGMRVLSRPALNAFAGAHPTAQGPLDTWYALARKGRFQNFAQVKATFGSADQVGGYVVFNIGGNKFRLIVTVKYATQAHDGIFWIAHVFTHTQYDNWTP